MRQKMMMVLALIAFGIMSVWADEVTEEQALQLARNFMTGHTKEKARLGSRSAEPDIESAGQVSGLYLFNVGENEGYVIVSNDDQTTPILGYSDVGAIDPDNMPDNMRAWLQGYAEEIEWLQQNVSSQSGVRKTRSATTRASQKSNIEPLIKTNWNQGAPYNYMTPYYGGDNNQIVYSVDAVEGYYHCATGCVATAMAQVMYYHKWPTQSTQAIPSYTWKSNTMPSLAVTTFDWDNMRTNYEDRSTNPVTILGTETQQTNIATLMKYCGYALEMNYGPQSGAVSAMIVTALKKYFDYNNTTQLASRNLYSYSKWVDLIYYELAQGRPVAYGGSSSGGGHEFVCDGYKYEGDTDLFHINWGWGGTSDGYFVLSALNPSTQGIGGSTSTDGYRYDQDAVIGIQKSTDNGTMSNIKPNVVNLTMNSMTLSHSSVVRNTEVTVTLNVTNNNADDFDGTLYLGNKNGNSYSLLVGDIFNIPARATRDCVLKFKPTGIGTYNLVFFEPNTVGSYSTDGTIWAELPVVSSNEGISTNLAVTNVTSNSAQLSWDDDGKYTAWQVGYKADGASDFTVVDATKPYVLTKLSPETEYTVKVIPSDPSGVTTWSPEFTFTTAAANPVPANVTISEVTPTSAKISWTGSAASYDVWYGVLPEGTGSESKWLQYDNGTSTGGFGNDQSTEWTWGVMYPGSMVTGNQLTQVSFYKRTEGTNTVTIKIYTGGDTAPSDNSVSTINVKPQDATGFQTVTFPNPIAITAGTNLWITLTETGVYPMALCSCSDANNQWYYNGISWIQNTGDSGWMIRGYIVAGSLDGVDWTKQSTTEQAYSLTDLNETDDYVVQVRSNYGSGSYSEWVTAYITKALELANDGANNNSLVGAWNEKTTTVTLAGRTLYKDGVWNTLCLPFALSETQLAASPLAGASIRTLSDATLSNGVLTLNFTDAVNSIEAGKPYIVKWTKADNYDTADAQTRDLKDPVFSSVTISNATNDITSGVVTFKGTYIPMSFGSTDESVLLIADNNKLYFPQSGASLGACRAYFKIVGASSARSFVLNLGDGDKATGIIGIAGKTDSADDSGDWYTLDGRKLNGKPTAKGIYVKKGKKMVVK